MKEQEEFLTIQQIAYLLKTTRRTIEYMIQTNKLTTVKSKKRTLIERTSFIKLIEEKLNQYSMAKRFVASERIPGMTDRLTVTQTAKLLKVSNQRIYKLIDSGTLTKYDAPGTSIIHITTDSIEKYLKTVDKKYERAMEYINCANTYDFWIDSKIEEEVYNPERFRRRKNE